MDDNGIYDQQLLQFEQRRLGQLAGLPVANEDGVRPSQSTAGTPVGHSLPVWSVRPSHPRGLRGTGRLCPVQGGRKYPGRVQQCPTVPARLWPARQKTATTLSRFPVSTARREWSTGSLPRPRAPSRVGGEPEVTGSASSAAPSVVRRESRVRFLNTQL
uniref:Uncharacterized protein n=1 Tax=Cacopsylla melanoneura TaxID=428564 RepID=A0A8D9BWZ3_9HEMI